jgi:hypothetical protein
MIDVSKARGLAWIKVRINEIVMCKHWEQKDEDDYENFEILLTC